MGLGGSKSYTTQSSAPAYAQPYLNTILSEAQSIYDQGRSPYYPSATATGMSPETQTGFANIRDTAMAGNPITTGLQNQVQQTLQGDYLNADNPYLQGAIKRATDPLIENFRTNVAPSIDSQFSGSGRYGSGLYAQARNRAEDTLTDSISDMAGDLAYRNFADERSRMQGLLGQADALSQIPYMDDRQLIDVGQAREGYQQADLDSLVRRFNAEQGMPTQLLDDYSNFVRRGTVGGQQSQPVQSDPFGQFLSTMIALGSLPV